MQIPNKNIIFYFNEKYGSSYLRGSQVATFLKLVGYNVYVTNKFPQGIKNCIIFVIKNNIKNVINFHRSNVVIWDVVDFIDSDFKYDLFYKYSEYVNHLIFHNNNFPKFLKQQGKLIRPTQIIPHHWDARLNNIQINQNKFNIGYVGDNKSSMFLNMLTERFEIKTDTNFTDNSFIEIFKNYNCHFDIKDPESFKFKTCSAIKISTAAVLGCPIITNKTWSNLHLIGDESSFYCDENEYAVQEKIEEFSSAFGTAKWNNLTDPLKEIKEKTSIENIIKLYQDLIHRVC